MVLLFGTSTKEKKLDFTQSMLCSNCGLYGKYEVFMTYSHFSLFFIPLFNWNKKYYVISTCCNSKYRLDKNIGRAIERGDNININESDMDSISVHKNIMCSNCKFPIEAEFEYCPKCGAKTK